MRWWKNDNQKMADRRRKVRMERISGERRREQYGLSSGLDGTESIPETKIKMMNGYYYLVKDSEDSILEQMKGFFRSCFVSEDKGKDQ